MLFKRSFPRYGTTPEPETPYQRAGQLWDERIGSARVQARNWRLMAFSALALAASLAAALIWQSSQSRITPYVVEGDRLGEATPVSPAEILHQPTDPEIAWALAHFISNVRSVSLDPVLMRANWLEAFNFTTRRGAQALGAYARAANPFSRIGEYSQSAQVTSVVRASDRSFQIKWLETSFEHGNEAGTAHWTAILTIVTKAPTTADALRKNPLGIFVDAIDWSRELEPSGTTTSLPSAANPSARSPSLSAAPPVSEEVLP